MTTTSTVSTSGSTTYLTGTISGLDTDSLIEAAVAQKTARADTIDAKVTTNETKIASYQELQTLLQAVSDSMESLASTTYSSVSTTTNAFDEKSAYLTASDGTDATDVLAVSADADAVAASYSITVTQLAKAMKVASTAQTADTVLGLDGVFSLNTTDGTAAEITVTSDMTVEDLADAINNASGDTGVVATLIASSTGTRLVLSTSDTNQEITLSTVSGDDIGQSVGLTDSAGDFSNVLQEAQPAIVTIDGVEIESDSNELTDTIPGLSISLLQATSGQTITLDIEANYDDIKTAITDFITAYNALRSFVVTNQTVGSDGTVSDDAVLFADSILRDVNRRLSDMLGGTAGSDDELTDLSALGVTINADNQLELTDETTLDNLLLTDLSSVAKFFETGFSSSNSNLKLLKNDTTVSFDFDMQVNVTDGAISSVSVNGDSSLFTISGNRIIGATGSIYEGLSFALASPTSGTISVEINQGFANMITSLIDDYANTSSGVIQQRIESLETVNEDLTDQSDQIRDDAETYRTKLISKYSAMETELYAAQILQQQIAAILGADSSDDD
ncbi:flagellar hook protein [Caulobacter sp. D4A]|uniref:flagellar filament capping protein FliD n=1 Tax=unclassified Caulobacter TaxID=2648921 RepID=UPI000D73E0F0|nr:MULTISPECIES: flagellar filament capping protein FliD [unclassified Caulobacter]PXA82561.1 flagellar hook protein [Caulobacter sp. D4A]PXA93620.1 flagellar hook protein [Caulobacter sp. D5]